MFGLVLFFCMSFSSYFIAITILCLREYHLQRTTKIKWRKKRQQDKKVAKKVAAGGKKPFRRRKRFYLNAMYLARKMIVLLLSMPPSFCYSGKVNLPIYIYCTYKTQLRLAHCFEKAQLFPINMPLLAKVSVKMARNKNTSLVKKSLLFRESYFFHTDV